MSGHRSGRRSSARRARPTPSAASMFAKLLARGRGRRARGRQRRRRGEHDARLARSRRRGASSVPERQHRARDQARGAATLDGGARYEEVTTRATAPGGVAVIVEALTDNRNRTAAGGPARVHAATAATSARPAATAWMFARKGVDPGREGRGAGRGQAARDRARGRRRGPERRRELLGDHQRPGDVHRGPRRDRGRAGIPMLSAELTMLPEDDDPGRGRRGQAGPAPDRGARGARRRPERLRELRHPRNGDGRARLRSDTAQPHTPFVRVTRMGRRAGSHVRLRIVTAVAILGMIALAACGGGENGSVKPTGQQPSTVRPEIAAALQGRIVFNRGEGGTENIVTYTVNPDGSDEQQLFLDGIRRMLGGRLTARRSTSSSPRRWSRRASHRPHDQRLAVGAAGSGPRGLLRRCLVPGRRTPRLRGLRGRRSEPDRQSTGSADPTGAAWGRIHVRPGGHDIPGDSPMGTVSSSCGWSGTAPPGSSSPTSTAQNASIGSHRWTSWSTTSSAGWSPDGSEILFAGCETEEHHKAIWVVNADGTSPHPLQIGGSVAARCWIQARSGATARVGRRTARRSCSS